eukprot:Sspe_Gene.89124::Locus_60976_Transcript_1_1_Confidence_1.000_Length_2330::g.89124::m.89124
MRRGGRGWSGGGTGSGGGEKGKPPASKGSQRTGDSVLAVGFVGLNLGSAEVVNSILRLPLFHDLPSTDPSTSPQVPVSLQTSYVPHEGFVHLYLPPVAVTPPALVSGFGAFVESPGAQDDLCTNLTDFVEDRTIQYLRSLSFLLTVCHVVVFVNSGHTHLDVAILRLLRLAQAIRQAVAPALGKLTSGPFLSGSQFSPGRILPVAAFMWGAHGGKATQKTEQSLELQLRCFLRHTRLLGSAAERDGPDAPIVTLDPHRCAFVEEGSLVEFLERQYQYFHRQMAGGGQRYAIPSLAMWECEATVIDIIMRLDYKFRVQGEVVAEHRGFSRIHGMLNPLYKLSYQRCDYAVFMALEAPRNWQHSLAVFNKFAIGPLQHELRAHLRREHSRKGHHPQAIKARYTDDDEMTTPQLASSPPSSLVTVVTPCGTDLAQVEDRHDPEAGQLPSLTTLPIPCLSVMRSDPSPAYVYLIKVAPAPKDSTPLPRFFDHLLVQHGAHPTGCFDRVEVVPADTPHRPPSCTSSCSNTPPQSPPPPLHGGAVVCTPPELVGRASPPGKVEVLVEYACMQSGVRYSLDVRTIPGIIRGGPLITSCDIPLFIHTPKQFSEGAPPSAIPVSQLQRLYLVTNAGQPWRLSPSFVFFRRSRRHALPHLPPKSRILAKGNPQDDDDEILHEHLITKGIMIPKSSVIAVRVPQTFPTIDLHEYSRLGRRGVSSSCYLLHGFLSPAG